MTRVTRLSMARRSLEGYVPVTDAPRRQPGPCTRPPPSATRTPAPPPAPRAGLLPLPRAMRSARLLPLPRASSATGLRPLPSADSAAALLRLPRLTQRRHFYGPPRPIARPRPPESADGVPSLVCLPRLAAGDASWLVRRCHARCSSYSAAFRLLARHRIPASIKSSISPSNTAPVLPTSCSVRRSLTIWYGLST